MDLQICSIGVVYGGSSYGPNMIFMKMIGCLGLVEKPMILVHGGFSVIVFSLKWWTSTWLAFDRMFALQIVLWTSRLLVFLALLDLKMIGWGTGCGAQWCNGLEHHLIMHLNEWEVGESSLEAFWNWIIYWKLITSSPWARVWQLRLETYFGKRKISPGLFVCLFFFFVFAWRLCEKESPYL